MTLRGATPFRHRRELHRPGDRTAGARDGARIVIDAEDRRAGPASCSGFPSPKRVKLVRVEKFRRLLQARAGLCEDLRCNRT